MLISSHVNEDCTEMVYKGSHNISIAMQTPAGLLVPNVKVSALFHLIFYKNIF